MNALRRNHYFSVVHCFTFVTAAFLSFGGSVPVVLAQVGFPLLQAIFGPPPGRPYDNIGQSIAVDGNFAVANAFQSSDPKGVHVYDVQTGALLHVLSDPRYAEQAGFPSGRFGQAVAISGTKVVVAAEVGPLTGSGLYAGAFVYDLTSSTPAVPILTLQNPGAPGSTNTISVAISGNLVVAGNPDNVFPAQSLVGVAMVYDLASANPTVPVATLFNPAFAPNGRVFLFGKSVAISGSRVAVGAPSDTGLGSFGTPGAVYVFDLAGTLPAAPVAVLRHPDVSPLASASFGEAVAISGTRVVVGAPSDATGGSLTGSAYAFDLAGATPSVPVAQMLDPNAAARNQFGTSVAISGTRIVVGVGASATEGAAYAYDLAGGTPGTATARLINPNSVSQRRFGDAVAVSGNRAVVGQPQFSKAAYAYDLAGPTPGAAVATLTSDDPPVDRIGRAVATAQARIAITDLSRTFIYDGSGGSPTVPVFILDKGSPNPDSLAMSGTRVAIAQRTRLPGGGNTSEAFIYDLSSGTPTAPAITLPNVSSGSSGVFPIALSGSRLAVGDPFFPVASQAFAGRVTVYDIDGANPATPVATFTAATPRANGFFGRKVAISGQRLVIDSRVYDLASATPTVPVLTLPAFGTLAFSGARLVVGVPAGGAKSGGVAYLIDLASATPAVAVHTFNNPSPAAGDAFGEAVAITGNVIVVGARGDDAGAVGLANGAGRAYVYDLTSATPTVPVATLDKPTGKSPNDVFATAVATDGDLVVVGAPTDLSGGVALGAAYVFKRGAVPGPTATTGPATTESATKATLRGIVNPMGASTAVSFEYGLTTSYGSAAPAKPSPLKDTFAQTVSASLSGLAPDTIYHYRLKAVSSVGTTFGADGAFITPASLKPIVTTGAASDVTTTSATIEGMVNASGATATAAFELHTQTIGFLATGILATPSVATGTTTGSVAATLSGLVPNTTYFYRLNAAGSGSVGFGQYKSFTTGLSGAVAIAVTGGAATGAGEVGSGVPAGATWVSFGVPAIDDAGEGVFSAKWKSATGSGSGIFTTSESVAQTGGPVPDLAGATFKTFGEPVIDGGRVAFAATLAGVPAASASVIVSDAPTGGLAVIARAGDSAPDANGAKFQSFKAIEVKSASVAVLAQLATRTGTPPVTADSDLGVWVQDATHPLTLVLREGQVVGGKTIKTLVSFATGNGSPGQGRGWLLTPGGAPEVLALALFTDKTQAVLGADLTGTAAVFSQSGVGGTGAPDIAGASFASYSFPTANEAGESAFLGTLALGAGGVTADNERAIFLNPNPALYTPIARLGAGTGTSGETFSLLKDPVLASDGSLAFPATVKGGRALSTLWWKPAGNTLALLARAGVEPPDVTGGQWKEFPSLAISDLGPLFAATMVPGKGGVTGSSAAGVWAMDSTGALRLMIRTGEVIGGRKLQSFTLLNAVPGTLGVRRSFNDIGRIVYRATFADRTQAITTVQIP